MNPGLVRGMAIRSRHFIRACSAALLVVSGLALGGCTGEGALPDAAGNLAQVSGGDSELTLVSELPTPAPDVDVRGGMVAVGDAIEVNVYGMDKLSRSVQVDSAGNISLPLINAVRAANRTLPELERAIAAAYGRYLQQPSVTLLLKDSPARRVVIDGQVARPGVYAVNERSNLSQAIAEAGGLNNIADQNKVFVYRTVNGKQYVANYSVAEIRANQRPAPRIFGRDTVVVFSSSSRVAWQNVKDALGLAHSATSMSLLLAK